MTALLSTTYFGPIQWYQKHYRYDQVEIDSDEYYQKQTYRNRCVIATTQGTQALVVPVIHGSPLTKDIRISDHGNWRRQHWNALVTAYADTPYFNYYQDDLSPFFTQRWDYLFDFNEAIRQTVCQLLDIESEKKTEKNKGQVKDFRTTIRPKHPDPDPEFQPRRYYQVFAQKHGFLPNLSILDLLFNMGPESIFFL